MGCYATWIKSLHATTSELRFVYNVYEDILFRCISYPEHKATRPEWNSFAVSTAEGTTAPVCPFRSMGGLHNVGKCVHLSSMDISILKQFYWHNTRTITWVVLTVGNLMLLQSIIKYQKMILAVYVVAAVEDLIWLKASKFVECWMLNVLSLIVYLLSTWLYYIRGPIAYLLWFQIGQ